MPASILWRRLDRPGHEVAWIEALDGHWALTGTAVFGYEGAPCRFDYRVVCAADWRTIEADVEGRIGERRIALHVDVDPELRWRVNGADCAAVRGCLDIDLGFSPSTNLLPIRRQALAVGESAEVLAAWLPFPSFTVEPLRQVYRRESPTAYRYASGDGAYVCVLDVDEVGFVTRYPGLWQAVP